MEPCAALVARSQSALDTNRDVALICWGLVGVQPTWPCTLFTLLVVMQCFLLFKSGSASLFPTRCLLFNTNVLLHVVSFWVYDSDIYPETVIYVVL